MIEIKQYFAETVHKNEYYNYKFRDLINMGIMNEYWIVDDEDAIEKFKDLVLPYNDNNTLIDKQNDECFIYLCNYLYNKGYYIEEFPKYLERPTDRWDFSYNKVREKIIERDGYFGSVAWADRRVFVNSLIFIKREDFIISHNMSQILRKISTRDAEFIKMELDEKLEVICNCIEYLLKPNKKSDKFIVLDYSDSLGYLSDDGVKEFRNRLECFRHSTKDDLSKRNAYSDAEKSFLISYGLLIVDFINARLLK